MKWLIWEISAHNRIVTDIYDTAYKQTHQKYYISIFYFIQFFHSNVTCNWVIYIHWRLDIDSCPYTLSSDLGCQIKFTAEISLEENDWTAIQVEPFGLSWIVIMLQVKWSTKTALCMHTIDAFLVPSIMLRVIIPNS